MVRKSCIQHTLNISACLDSSINKGGGLVREGGKEGGREGETEGGWEKDWTTEEELKKTKKVSPQNSLSQTIKKRKEKEKPNNFLKGGTKTVKTKTGKQLTGVWDQPKLSLDRLPVYAHKKIGGKYETKHNKQKSERELGI